MTVSIIHRQNQMKYDKLHQLQHNKKTAMLQKDLTCYMSEGSNVGNATSACPVICNVMSALPVL